MDITQLFPAAGLVGLFAATGVVLTQMLRQNNRLNMERESIIALQNAEIVSLKADAHRCNARVDLLINACQRGGIEVPREVWHA